MKPKNFLLGVVLAIIATLSVANTGLVTFNNLPEGGRWYVEDGYKFESIYNFQRDINFQFSTPSFKWSGYQLNISRLDGAVFSVVSFDVLAMAGGESTWWIGNENGTGYQIGDGKNTSASNWPGTLTNIKKAQILGSNINSRSLIIFDNFQFASPVPEPSQLLFFISGILFLSAVLTRNRLA